MCETNEAVGLSLNRSKDSWEAKSSWTPPETKSCMNLMRQLKGMIHLQKYHSEAPNQGRRRY